MALDDFGTGYSSLAYLADLPLDRLKLDQSFVRRLPASPRTARLVTGLVHLVHDLGCPLVAEGGETAAEQALLAELGVEWLQGCPVSRPLPPDRLEQWWRAVDSTAPAGTMPCGPPAR